MIPDNIKPKDWISIGDLDAVVCHIYDSDPSKIEVVYIDYKNRAINKDAIFKDGEWIFALSYGGGYADNYPRLAEYVRILRAQRWR